MVLGVARFLWPALAALLPLGAGGSNASGMLNAGGSNASGMLDVEPPAAQQLLHRRVLLQTPGSRRAFGSVNHLIIFTGLQSSRVTWAICSCHANCG
jgi:hypothetical protein